MVEPYHFWIAMALNPLEERLTVLSCAETKEEADQSAKNLRGEDDLYYLSVDLAAADSPALIHQWVLDSGVPSDEAKQLLKQLSAQMRKMMESED